MMANTPSGIWCQFRKSHLGGNDAIGPFSQARERYPKCALLIHSPRSSLLAEIFTAHIEVSFELVCVGG